jgi:hypothetical protein
MALVHTTFRETPFEMGAEEAESLRKQGLLREPPPDPPADGPPVTPGPPGAPAKAKKESA